MVDLVPGSQSDFLVDSLVEPPPQVGAFKRGFGAGMAGVKGSMAGAGALVAHGIGAVAPAPVAAIANTAEQGALDYAHTQEAVAAENGQKIEDVDWTSPTSVVGHFKHLLGQAVPSLALMFAGGAAGRGFGALAGKGSAAAKNAGMFAGAVLPDVALESGSIYPEALKTGVENPAARAAVGGAAAASLDFLPLLAAHRYMGAAGKGGFGAMAKTAAKGAPIGAVVEGTQELGQTVIERLAAGQDLTGPDAISDYINSFAGGAAPGALFGAGAGALHGRAAPAPVALPAPVVASEAAPAPVQEPAPFTNREQPAPVNTPLPTIGGDGLPFIQADLPAHALPSGDPILLPQPSLEPTRTPGDTPPVAAPQPSVPSDPAALAKQKIEADALARETERRATADALSRVREQHGLPRLPEALSDRSMADPVPQSPRAAALAKVESRARESVASPDATAQMKAVEPHAMAVIEPMAKTLAEAKTAKPGGQRKIADNLTKAMRAVVADAVAMPTVEAAQAHIEAKLPEALKGHGVAKDAADIAKAVSVAVGQAKTQYSKGAQRPPIPDQQTISQEEWAANYSKVVGGDLKVSNTKDLYRALNYASHVIQRLQSHAQRGEAYSADLLSSMLRERIALKSEWMTRADRFESNAALTQPEYDALPEAGKAKVMDEYNRIMTAKGTALIGRLKQLIGDDPDLMVTTHQAEPGSPIGSYTRVDTLKSVIALATNAKDGLSVADHEGYHYAEDRLLDARERQIVARALEKDSTIYNQVMAKVQAYDLQNRTSLADEVAGTPAEARAYAFEFWRRGQLQADGALGRVWQKLKVFMERVSNAVKGLGFTAMEDVFTALDRGQFAERTRGPGPVVDSPQFKTWFGDSKVVDEQGAPLVVYHGTAGSAFSEFSDAKLGSNTGAPSAMVGHFFTARPATADYYSGDKGYRGHEVSRVADNLASNMRYMRGIEPEYSQNKERFESHAGPNVMPVYLAIKNPLVHDFKNNVFRDEKYRNLIDQAKREGRDGVILKNTYDAGEYGKFDAVMRGRFRGETIYVAFGPAQIKSAIGNTGTFDPTNPDIRYSTAGDQKWYRSALTDAVTAMNTKQASAQGWREQIKGLVAKGAIKQAEIDAVGLEDYLETQKGKVTKEQMLAFLGQNGVQVSEVMLGGTRMDVPAGLYTEQDDDAAGEADGEGWVVRNHNGEVMSTGGSEAEAIANLGGDAPTKFAQYQLPGGTNYREVLLALPEKGRGATEAEVDRLAMRLVDKGMDGLSEDDRALLKRGGNEADAMLDDLDARVGIRTDDVRQAMTGGAADSVFRSSHYDQPNILAHVRFNERTDVEGKRVLFVEEFQSDWAKEGRAAGFTGARKPLKDITREELAQILTQLTPPTAAQKRAHHTADYAGDIDGIFELITAARGGGLEGYDRVGEPRTVLRDVLIMDYNWTELAADQLQRKLDDYGVIHTGVPSAPFVTKTEAWVRLSINRMIRYAAENGFDKVAWTTGEQQSSRYDLSKQVEQIRYVKRKDGTYNVWASHTDGSAMHDNLIWKKINADQIEKYVGKDVAQKIIDNKGRDDPKNPGDHVLEGMDLKVGGEGMKGFYDRIVPSVANDILKKLGGGKVGEVNIPATAVTAGDKKDWSDVKDMVTGYIEGGYSDEEFRDQTGLNVTDAELEDLRSYGADPYRRGPIVTGFIKAMKDRHASGKRMKQPGFELTPKMVEKAAEGLPLFSRGAVDQSADGMGRVLNALTPKQRTLYSQAATQAEATILTRAAAGELQQEQVFAAAAKMLEDAQAHGADNLVKTALGSVNTHISGGLSRWYQKNIATPNFVSSMSNGYKNVFKTLNTFIRYRDNLVERMLIQQIPAWYTATTEDQTTAFTALNKRNVDGLTRDSQALKDLKATLTPKQLDMFNTATKMFEGFLTKELEVDDAFYRKVYTTPGLYDEQIGIRREQVAALIDKGYMPLRRYGDHTVRVFMEVPDAQGQPSELVGALEFFQHEATARLAAKTYEDEIARTGAKMRVEVGMHYKPARDSSVSAQQFLETARRNGVPLTATEQERIVKALSAGNALMRQRMLHREGMPGYSKDGMRVMNEFGMRMAGKLAYAEFAHVIDDAVAGRAVEADVVNGQPVVRVDRLRVDHEGTSEPASEYEARNLWALDGPMSGFHRGMANELTDYVMVPDHTGGWSRKLRGAAMMYFIGGSLSGAAVNAMSVPMMVVPQLSIHTPYTNAASTTLSAWKTAWRSQHILRDVEKLKERIEGGGYAHAIPGVDEVQGLREALIAATQYTMDTELHQIMGISQGQFFSQNQSVQRAMKAWMSPFRVSEQTNRITSFIAGYNVGKSNGLTGPALFNFARDTVDATQNSYSEANRPGLARHPIYALLMMFKSFPLFMVEAIGLMYKANPKSAIYMLLGLTAMTGVQGLPFAETIEDLIDTIAQHIFGSPFNSRRAMRNMIKSASEAITGYDASELVLRGAINAVTGMSVSSRIGAGDFVPGSRLGTADADQGRILEQFLGAPYAMVKDVAGSAAGAIAGLGTGDWKKTVDALRAGGPVALRNAIKGGEQVSDGYASDSKGRRLVDVNGLEGILQTFGFAPAGLAKAYEMDRITQQVKAFHSQASADMQHQLMLALKGNDMAKAQDIMALRDAWNRQYPEMPIMASAAAIRREMLLSGLTLPERTLRLLGRRNQGMAGELAAP